MKFFYEKQVNLYCLINSYQVFNLRSVLIIRKHGALYWFQAPYTVAINFAHLYHC